MFAQLNWRRLCVVWTVLFIAAGVVASRTFAAPVTVFTVNSTLDQRDATPGDNTCETGAGNGICTLRAAIEEANAIGGENNIVLRADNYSLSLPGAEDDALSGDLDITAHIILEGVGQNSTTIDGSEIDRVFHVQGTGFLQIDGVTIRDGLAVGTSNAADGGGILVDAGGKLEISNSTVTNNTAGYWGGGIHVGEGAEAKLDRVIVQNNVADTLGGGIDNYKGTLTIINSTIQDNAVSDGPGGGLYNGSDATTEIVGSTIDSNSASTDGAGIYNYAGSFVSSGMLTVRESTISNNEATLNGGGIYNLGDIALLENVTISGNIANDKGGGIFNLEQIDDINYVTIATNRASSEGGGIYNQVSSPISVRNTIIADNIQFNCKLENAVDMTSGGNNLESGNTCDFDQPTDTTDVNPLLGALADNGGGTLTHLPAEGSLAIDAAAGSTVPATDQRLVTRPQGMGYDIGAVEREVADLSIHKADDPDFVYADAELTYTLTIENAGQSAAKQVVVTDTLPAETTFVSVDAPSPTACSHQGNGIINCTKPQLAVGEILQIEIVVTAPQEGGVITNVAGVKAITMDLNTANNTASEETVVVAVADLSLTKEALSEPVNAGEPLRYELVVNNSGPGLAEGVVLTDTLSAGVTFVAADGDGWLCAYDTVTSVVRCEKDVLPTGDSAPILIDVEAPDAGGQLYNVATVSAETVDLDGANNSAETYTTIIAKADLAVTKSDAPNPVYANQPVTYTIEAVNNGPSAATNVIVTDTLPLDTEFVSATAPAGWDCDYLSVSHSVRCTSDVVATGGGAHEISVVILATAEPQIMSNTVVISSDALDLMTGNNTFTIETEVIGVADLEISQTHTPEPVDAGDTIVYTLLVENAGPSTAENVTVSSMLPDDVTIVSVTSSGWNCAFNNTTHQVNCSLLSDLSVGNAPTIEVKVTAPAEGGTTVNTASVQSSVIDFDPDDNTSVEDVTVTAVADLRLSLSDSPDPVNVNATLLYNATLTNNGPSRAEDIVYVQKIPAPVTYVSATGSDWSCNFDANFDELTCELSTLPSDEVTTIAIVVETPATGTLLQSEATVTSSVADRFLANNTADEITYVNPADVEIEWINAPPHPVAVGLRDEYALRITNHGLGEALDTVVMVSLPTGVSMVSCAGCEMENGILRYELGNMDAGDVEIVTFGLRADSQGYRVANAWVESPVVHDVFPSNNTTEVTVSAYLQFMPLMFGQP